MKSMLERNTLLLRAGQKMRACFPFFVAFLLCGYASQKVAEAVREYKTADRACDAQYPRTQLDLASARASCLNDADDRLLNAGFPYPDLIYRRQAERLSIAGRLQHREITLEAADIELKLFQADVG